MEKFLKKFLKSKTLIQIFITMFLTLSANFYVGMEQFKKYIKENTLKSQQFQQNTQSIKNIDVKIDELKKNIENLSFKIDHLRVMYHEYDIKLSDLNEKLKNTIDYQQVLRKEVKQNAQQKINIQTYWRNMNNVLIRVRWLEENKK